jgi:branched-chain amino acid transport system substrate-binding protein
VISGATTTWAADPVRVGVIQPLTGQGANVAKSFLEGLNLAVELINKDGGILGGRMIDPIIEDDQCIPAQSVAATKKLIYEDKVQLLLGAMCSSTTIADIPITKAAGIVHIVPISYADSITEMGHPRLFRTSTTNTILANGLAYKIANDFKVKSIVFYSINDDYGRGLVEGTKKIFEELGSTKVLYEGYFEQKERDFSTPITKMKGLDAEAMYLIARFPQNAQILNQMAELGFKPRLFGPVNLVANDCIGAAGKNVEGAHGVVNWSNELATPAARKFIDAFQAKYGKLPPDDFSNWGYTGMMVAAKAMDKAGTDKDPEKIAEALRGFQWDAPAGPLSFDDKGQGTISVYVVQVKDGKRVLAK